MRILSTLSVMTLLLAMGASPLVAEEVDLGSIRRLLRQEAPSDRAAALRRLAGCEDPRALALLLDALDDEHPYVRGAAAGVLGAVAPALQARLGPKCRRLKLPRARVAAARMALLWASRAGDDLLDALARDRVVAVRVAALEALTEQARTGHTERLDPIRRGLEDGDGLVRAVAIDALVACEAADELRWPRFLADPDARVRLAALEGSVAQQPISRHRDTAVVAVTTGSTDAVWSVRLRAAELSPRVEDRRVLPLLIHLLDDPRQRIRDAAHGALVRITSIPFDPDPEVWRAWLEGDGQSFDPGAGATPERGAPRRGPRHVPPGGTIARPRFLDLPLASRHLAFVLDASGSMARRGTDGRRRWDTVVEELDAALERLASRPGPSAVNVICFADEAAAVYPQARRLNAGRRAEIRAFLDAVQPTGSTALFDGIAAALADPDVDSVVLLSDGAPSAGLYFTKTALLREVARRNRFRRARIDVIQVGTNRIARRWRDALSRISQASGGQVVRR